MGKQYNFFMGKEDEDLFMEYLLQNKYLVYQDDTSGKPKIIDRFPEPFSNKGCFTLYIYRPDFGKIKFAKNGDKFFLDAGEAPVIEFARTTVRPERKEIQVGRIWVKMQYYDEEGRIIKKNDKLSIGYNDIKKWIKKRLKKVELQLEDVHIKGDFSESLVKLIIKEGYR